VAVAELISREAEMSTLGSAFLSVKACDQMCNTLRSEMFHQPGHRAVFAVMCEIRKGGGEPDLVTVRAMLTDRGQLQEVGGIDYLAQVAEFVPSPANVMAYSGIVLEKWQRREIIARSERIVKAAHESGMTALYGAINGLGQGLADETTNTATLPQVMDMIDEQDNDPQWHSGVSTGFPQLDELSGVGGWPIGEPSIVQGPTGKGKSCIMTQGILHSLGEGRRVGCITFEMDAPALARRMLHHLCGWEIMPRTIDRQAEYLEAKDRLRDPFFGECVFYDPSKASALENRVEDVVRWATAQNEQCHLQQIWADYAQLIGSERRFGSGFEEHVYVMRVMQKLARRINSPVIVLSQQNDEGRTAGSKEFEKASGLTVEIAPDQASLVVKKARHGQTASIAVRFRTDRIMFEEL
jgi:replicative DNA helicase